MNKRRTKKVLLKFWSGKPVTHNELRAVKKYWRRHAWDYAPRWFHLQRVWSKFKLTGLYSPYLYVII